MRRSIAWKITAVAVLCGLIPTLVAIGYNLYATSRRQTVAVQQRGESDLADRQALIEGQVRKFKELLVTTAVNPAFTRYFQARDEGERAAWRREAEKAVAHLTSTFKGMIDESCFLAAGGAELARVTFGEPAPPADLSPDESEAPFFAPALAADRMQVVVAGPYVSPDSERPVLAFATPVVAEDGRRLAVLHMEVPLAYFQEAFARLDTGGARTMLVDPQGRVLVRSDRPVPNGGEFPTLAQTIGLPRPPAGMAAVRGEAGSWLVHGAEIPDLRQSVVVAWPDDRRQVLVRQLVEPLFVAGLATLLIAAVAYALSRRVAGPIRQLAAAATALVRGDTRSAALITGIRTGDESEVLARDFLRVSRAFQGLLDNRGSGPSSTPSTRCSDRRTCWPSTPPSRRPAPAVPARASPSSPRRCDASPTRSASPRARSRRSRPASAARSRPWSTAWRVAPGWCGGVPTWRCPPPPRWNASWGPWRRPAATWPRSPTRSTP